jgi:pimeloyl-ACP methyl ester carboxylesterase
LHVFTPIRQDVIVVIILKQAFLKVNGLNIRYREAGRSVLVNGGSTGDNSSKMQNVLFIHGLGSSADRWLDIPTVSGNLTGDEPVFTRDNDSDLLLSYPCQKL